MKIITLKHLDKICELTDKILGAYNELCELDINGKKNSKEYQDVLQKLYLLKEDEYKHYEYFIKNLDEAGKAVSFLTEKSNKPLEAATSVLMDNDEQEMQQYRIITKLYLIALMDENYFFNDVDEELLELASGEEKMNFLRDAWMLDGQEINYRTISFLEKIMHQDYETFTAAKYNMSFMVPMAETEYVSNGFNAIKRDFNNHILKSYEGVSDDFIDYTHLIKSFDNACVTLEVLSDFYDSDLEDPEANVNFNILLAEFKASLLFLDEDGMEDIMTEFNDILASEKYIRKHEDDETIRNIIEEIITNFEVERDYANKDIGKDYELK